MELIETVLVEPRAMTIEQAESFGFKQFACKIGAKMMRTPEGQIVGGEPLYFHFNAPTYTQAFDHARKHLADEQRKAREEISKANVRKIITPGHLRIANNGH